MPTFMSDKQRFFYYCQLGRNECWDWVGGKDKDGYGYFKRNAVGNRAHRYSYWLYKGSIPEGFELDHLCKNRACVNPEHLEAVTSYENFQRGNSPMAHNVRKTHCKRGHLFDEKNTLIVSPNGINKQRICRTCKRHGKRMQVKGLRYQDQ